jgi:hypothetical protein
MFVYIQTCIVTGSPQYKFLQSIERDEMNDFNK